LDPSDRQNFKREVPVLARIQAELRVAAQAGPKLSFQSFSFKKQKTENRNQSRNQKGKAEKRKKLGTLKP
jgi:hypothetical protein